MSQNKRKNETPEQKEKRLERLRNLPEKDYSAITEIVQMPSWVKLALTAREIYELTWEEALKHIGRRRGVRTLQEYARCPAGVKWLEGVRTSPVLADPVASAKELIKESIYHVTMDKMLALEWAKANHDAALVDKITSDLLNRADVIGKGPKLQGPSTVILQLPSNMEIPTIQSTYKALPGTVDVDFEIEEDGGNPS